MCLQNYLSTSCTTENEEETSVANMTNKFCMTYKLHNHSTRKSIYLFLATGSSDLKKSSHKVCFFAQNLPYVFASQQREKYQQNLSRSVLTNLLVFNDTARKNAHRKVQRLKNYRLKTSFKNAIFLVSAVLVD